MYVALTRAQDKLILTVPLSSGKTAKPFAKAAAFLAAGAGATLHQQANSFADWLRAALLVHPDGGVLRQLSGNRELLFVQTESAMDIKVCDDAVQLSEEPDAATPDEAPETDPALVETLRQGFAWQYPAAALAQVPAKVSVTSIVHKAEQTTLERPGFLSKDGLTAAEMGTALHAFLEHADFARLAAAKAAGTLDEAIPAERDRQVAVQLTAPEIAEKLDAVCIRRFVESEAFAKICAAAAGAAGAALHHGAARRCGTGGTGARSAACCRRRAGAGAGHRRPCAGVPGSSGTAGLQDRPPQSRERFPARLPRPAEPLRHCHRKALCTEKGDL